MGSKVKVTEAFAAEAYRSTVHGKGHLVLVVIIILSYTVINLHCSLLAVLQCYFSF